MLLDSSDAPNVSLAEEIHWFKTMTTNMYIRSVKEEGWPPFSGRFWQRNYWEHIIRSDEELYQVRDYIRLNPVKWEEDSLNSFCGK
jgi:REP element-mobilizing transposase RayT